MRRAEISVHSQMRLMAAILTQSATRLTSKPRGFWISDLDSALGDNLDSDFDHQNPKSVEALALLILDDVLLESLSLRVIRLFRQKLFIFVSRPVFQAGAVVKSGEPKMSFGVSDRVKLDRFIEVDDCLRALFDLQIRVAKQVVRIRRPGLGLDGPVQYFYGRVEIFLRDAKLPKVQQGQDKSRIRIQSAKIELFCIGRFIKLEVERSQFCPCNPVLWIVCDDLLKQRYGLVESSFAASRPFSNLACWRRSACRISASTVPVLRPGSEVLAPSSVMSRRMSVLGSRLQKPRSRDLRPLELDHKVILAIRNTIKTVPSPTVNLLAANHLSTA